jgi:methylenetetrahydrofolate dehydrogenase (NADP+)/methenyltetrahydrofolate cyclohydrolase
MIIDGKAIADEIQKEIAGRVQNCHGRKPCLAVMIIGEHSASKIYFNKKRIA